jgi:NADP-dependent 3-hydroxy acid dehydrogenase YdfG
MECMTTGIHMTRDMMGHMHEELKGVDILVNNAGIQYVSPVHEFPEDKWWVLLLAAVVGRDRGAAAVTVTAPVRCTSRSTSECTTLFASNTLLQG